MDVGMYGLASLQHCAIDHYENWHIYVVFCGEGSCAVLFVAALHQMAQFNQSPSCRHGHQKLYQLGSIPNTSLFNIESLVEYDKTSTDRIQTGFERIGQHGNWKKH
ncbi:hypothetical protein TNCV_2929861 [Trichonephila clavipes]|nr:hypothetical protein TNCV_2929861 [Trichonephila clavipes]